MSRIELNESGKVKYILVNLDNGKSVVLDPEKYPHFNYGYSPTVHKAQGITVDHSYIYVSGQFWDRHLLYVAGSRHRKSMDIYVDQASYANMNAFSQGIEKENLKDSVLNYPLNFARRRGLETETLYERVKKYLIEKVVVIKHIKNQLEESIQHRIQGRSKANQIEGNLYQGIPRQPAIIQQKESTEVELTAAKLEQLMAELAQAKKEKAHYRAYKATRVVKQEIKQISKNKKLYQEIKAKNIQLGKKLDLALEAEHEI